MLLHLKLERAISFEYDNHMHPSYFAHFTDVYGKTTAIGMVCLLCVPLVIIFAPVTIALLAATLLGAIGGGIIGMNVGSFFYDRLYQLPKNDMTKSPEVSGDLQSDSRLSQASKMNPLELKRFMNM